MPSVIATISATPASAASMIALAANAGGFAAAFAVSFAGHVRWTFPARQRRIEAALARFSAVAAGGSANAIAGAWSGIASICHSPSVSSWLPMRSSPEREILTLASALPSVISTNGPACRARPDAKPPRSAARETPGVATPATSRVVNRE